MKGWAAVLQHQPNKLYTGMLAKEYLYTELTPLYFQFLLKSCFFTLICFQACGFLWCCGIFMSSFFLFGHAIYLPGIIFLESFADLVIGFHHTMPCTQCLEDIFLFMATRSNLGGKKYAHCGWIPLLYSHWVRGLLMVFHSPFWSNTSKSETMMLH